MSASLSVGQGSLLLNISAPLESDGVTLRDDVIGTKVWISTSASFNPANSEGTLVYNGNSLLVSIPGLTPGTTYYVKYAIISDIDPTVYTISSAYSGVPRGEAQVIDISGYTNFVRHVDQSFTPASATIEGITTNITDPQFTWSITGGTLSVNTGQSVVVTPASNATNIALTLSVNGSNVVTAIQKTINLSVVYDGQTGQTGSPGSKVAYPSIYKWTTDATPPTRPSAATPALKYTWATADVGTPTGWSSTAPTNDTPGSYLWQITIPLSAAGSVTESDLLWNSESYPIRAIGYNGANGAKGDKGATGDTGGPGAKGDTGSPGSASFVIDRGASATDSAPTAQEVLDTIGRAPVAGDMAIVSYSNNTGAKNYKYITSWVLFNTYISGSLIVENTITGDKLVANTVTATKIDSRGLSIKDASGNIILSAGVPLDASNITPATSWVNGNISIASDGTLNNAGGGKVTIGGLGYTGDLNATYGAQAGVNLKDSTGAALGDDSVKSNLINLDWWKRGAVIPWSQNAEYNEILSIAPANADLPGLGPRGGNDLVWYCVENAGDGQSGGGWNANISSTLNPAKTYRFVVPIRVSGTQTNGYAYWGTNGVCNLNTTTENTNPYFAVADRTVLANDRWYLFVGYVFPYGSTNNTSDSAGIWDCKTGLKVQVGTNYCHTQTGVTGHRAYQYYAAAGSKQLFGRPMINVVDGTEPSLREYFESAALLNNSITIDSSGALQGVGTGAGTVVSNAKVNVDAAGAIQGIGTGEGTVVSNAKVIVDAAGAIQGIGTGEGTVVSNAKVIVDAAGAIQGIGTGEGTVVSNAKVNVDADGKLQGIGTGEGTVVSNAKVNVDAAGAIQGIGTGEGTVVSNSLLETATWTLFNATASGTTLTSSSSTSTWDSGARSVGVFPNGAYVSFSPTSTVGWAMVGLSVDSAMTLNAMRFAWFVRTPYPSASSPNLFIYEAGTDYSYTGVSYQVGDVLSITFDGSKVRYYKNNTLIREVAYSLSSGQSLYIKTLFATASCTIKKLSYGPMSSNYWSNIGGTGAGKPEDYATLGATSGVNLKDSFGTIIDALNKTGSDILSGTVSINAVTGAGFRSGNLQWNDQGVRTSGYGTAMTPGGLIGVDAAGNTTFSVSASTGNATFKGDITGASGTFSGNLNATGVVTGTIQGNSGYFKGDITGATGTFSGSLQAGTIDLDALVGQSFLYETAGTYTITMPYTGTVRINMCGAGGGGAGGSNGTTSSTSDYYGYAGSPGNKLGATVEWTNVPQGYTIKLIIGQGGAGGTGYPSSGGNGGSTTYQILNTSNAVVQSGTVTGGAGGSQFRYNGNSNSGAWGIGQSLPARVDTHSYRNPDPGDGWSGASGQQALGISGLSGSAGGVGGFYGRENVIYWANLPESRRSELNGTAGTRGGGGGGGSAVVGSVWSNGDFIGWRNAVAAATGAASSGGAGGDGYAFVEIFNPTGVVVSSEFQALKDALKASNSVGLAGWTNVWSGTGSTTGTVDILGSYGYGIYYYDYSISPTGAIAVTTTPTWTISSLTIPRYYVVADDYSTTYYYLRNIYKANFKVVGSI